jgi:hypothetical protein
MVPGKPTKIFAVESSGQSYQIVMTGKYPAKLPKHFDYKA